MRAFRFLHASDLHLDSPFRGLTIEDAAICAAIRRSTLDAFDNLVALAIDRHVDFVIIAGDVYDGADRSIRAQLHFRDGLARLSSAGISTFVAHGNHDPLDSRISAITSPERVHVFSGDAVETKPVFRDGLPIAAVSGYSFPTKQILDNVATTFTRETDQPFHIGVLHCNVGGNTSHDPYAPCTVDDLVATRFDYWALGHIHSHAVLHESPHVVYPGNTQGRHVRELGPRGCMLVDVDSSGSVHLTFEPLDAVRWSHVDVAIDDVSTVDGLEARLVAAVETAVTEAEQRPLLCRVGITGRGPLHRELAREATAIDLLDRARDAFAHRTPFVWIQSVDIASRPEIDLVERRRADDLLGQILRASEELRSGSEGLDRLRDEALVRLFGNVRVDRTIGKFSKDDLLELLAEAELLCVDRLETAR